MNKLDEKTIEQIANLYNETNLYTEAGENKNFNVYFQFSTEEIFDKFDPDYESCKKIDEMTDAWDNEDNTLVSIYFYKNDVSKDEQFCKDHKEDILNAMFEYICHWDGLALSCPEACELVDRYAKYVSRAEAVEWLQNEGVTDAEELI